MDWMSSAELFDEYHAHPTSEQIYDVCGPGSGARPKHLDDYNDSCVSIWAILAIVWSINMFLRFRPEHRYWKMKNILWLAWIDKDDEITNRKVGEKAGEGENPHFMSYEEGNSFLRRIAISIRCPRKNCGEFPD